MDGLMLTSLIHEWQNFIGYRIEKVHQPAERDLVLTLRGKSGNIRILLSAHRRFFRIHQLTKERPINPQEPPMFCMLGRKHLEGGRIVKIQQQGRDRVIEFHVDAFNEMGDSVESVLIVELMGKHSNIVLTTSDANGAPDKVIDSIVRVSRDMSSVRPILPGVQYVQAPVQEKVDIEDLTSSDMSAHMSPLLSELDWSSSSVKLAKKLPLRIAGIGPITAQEVLHRAAEKVEGAEHDQGTSAWTQAYAMAFVSELQSLSRQINDHQLTACVGLDEKGSLIAAAPFPLSFCPEIESFGTFDSALEEYYRESAIQNQASLLHTDLTRQIELSLDRLRAKKTKLQQELTRGEGHEEDRIKGEILTAYATQVEKGQPSVALPNFYADNELLRIELDEAKTAIQNAQAYFKSASKRKRALHLLASEVESVERDMAYLESCLLIVHDATNSELQDLQNELIQEEFLRPTRKSKSKKKDTVKQRPMPAEFRSSDGFPIFVGRNNAQNDWLTFRKSQPTDLWFHVKDQPGSHVVIRSSTKEVPVLSIEEAAAAAAYFSKGRESSNVAVDYTQIRHVWKPNGARPGFALYKEQKTLFVTPNRNIVKKITENYKRTQQADAHTAQERLD